MLFTKFELKRLLKKGANSMTIDFHGKNRTLIEFYPYAVKCMV